MPAESNPGHAHHQHGPGSTPPAAQDTEGFWEGFYQARDQVWSGRPNELLVRHASDLAPGTALDLGCAEGADAVWLAGRGWRVTAADVSATALGRAARAAADAGVGGSISWERHDLAETFPAGDFDLVTAAYLHSPVAGTQERAEILRRAAGVVAAGGVLLVIGHAGLPSWVDEPPHGDVTFPTTTQVLAELGLPGDRWRVEADEVVHREGPDPDGNVGTRPDNVLRIRRLAEVDAPAV